MANKPTVFGSDGTWGSELNEHLEVSLASDGKIKDGAAQTTSAAPGADAEIANKKYVDDEITTLTTYIDSTYLSAQTVQVVNTQTGAVASNETIIPHDDSIPQKTEGSEYMTLAITPTNNSNKLKIDIVFHLSVAIGNRPTIIALFQDDTADAIAGITTGADYPPRPVCFTHYMDAGTTSETTFKIRAGTDAAALLTFNGLGGSRKLGGIMASSITITEIKV